MKKLILLFDIDGTLIYSGGAGSRSIELAFKKLYNINKAMEGILPDGKTDPLIIEEVFIKKLNKKPTKKEIEKALEYYLMFLEKEIHNPRYRVMEGAEEFLEWAKGEKRFIIGLATGNIERGAEIKLKPASLLKYFEFGGYASDSWDRTEILKSAYRRGVEIAKREKAEIKEVFVIGDTPRDIFAAQKAGFKSIGMPLFNFKKQELIEAGAIMYLKISLN